ncbi:MAG: YceI family protein [Flammeovirgaceae bacterium]|nr:YceI family protein [Flammeovirgaceae bacterium]
MRILYTIILLTIANIVLAQKYTTESSEVSFFSKATMEDIKAANTKAKSIFVKDSGEVAFSIPIKDFEFDKNLMKEHFNEKYMETDKYPNSTFQGKITGYNSEITDEQQAKAIGKLSIHGITKEVAIDGIIQFNEGKISMNSKFTIKLEDYKIKIPQLLWQNIAEEIEVSIEFIYKPL